MTGSYKAPVRIVLLIAVMAMGLGAAHAAETLETRHLAVQCASDEAESARAASRVGFCMGFILGVVDSYDVWRAFIEKQLEAVPDRSFCIPEEVTVHDLRNRVVEWLAAHPDRIDGRPYSTVVAALVAAYPCATEADL
jgi:hypothetical protein